MGRSPTVGTVGEDTEAAVLVEDTSQVAGVSIDGVPAPDVRRLTSVVRFRIPGRASPETADVKVSGPSGTILAEARFKWVAVGERLTPYFDSVLPKTGPTTGGFDVWIVGAGFATGTTVRFGDVSAATTVVSDGLLRVIAPPSTRPGYVAVSVLTADGGSAAARAGFLYTRSQPLTQRTVRWSHREYVSPAGQGFLVPTDADRDGFTDVVVASIQGVGTLRGLDRERLRAPELFSPQHEYFYFVPEVRRPIHCDLDLDGRPDIMAVAVDYSLNRSWVTAFLGTPGGRFAVRRSAAIPFGGNTSPPTTAAPVDMDGDGDLDLLLADPYEVVAYRRVGPWRFERAAWTTLVPAGMQTTGDTQTISALVPLPPGAGREPEVVLVTYSPFLAYSQRIVAVDRDGRMKLDPQAPTLVMGFRYTDLRPTIADVDGDGVADVLALCLNEVDMTREERYSSTPPFVPWLYAVKALLRRPAGTTVAVLTREARDMLAVGDMDEDGDPDLVTGSSSGWEWRIIEGPSWTVTRALPSPFARVRSLTIGDRDRDGVNEIVRLEQGDDAAAQVLSARSLRRAPDGSYVQSGLDPLITSNDLGLNGGQELAIWLGAQADASPDILLWTRLGPLLVTVGPGGHPDTPWFDGPVQTSSWPTIGPWVHGDLDQDGITDLATSSTDMRTLSWRRGLGDGRFGALVALSSPSTSAFYPSAVADINRDGLADVVGVDNGGRGVLAARLGAAGPSFGDVVRLPAARPSPAPSMPMTLWVVAGDLDGDRFDDIFSGNFDYATWTQYWVETLMGRPAAASLLSNSVTSWPGLVRDLDGDGRGDVCWSEAGRIRVRLGDGSGGFPRAIEVIDPVFIHPGSSPPAPVAVQVGAGDLDGDGAIDLVACASDGRVFALLGQGGGWSPAIVLGVVGQAVMSNAGTTLVVNDLDGDGRAEVVVLAGGLVTVYRLTAE